MHRVARKQHAPALKSFRYEVAAGVPATLTDDAYRNFGTDGLLHLGQVGDPIGGGGFRHAVSRANGPPTSIFADGGDPDVLPGRILELEQPVVPLIELVLDPTVLERLSDGRPSADEELEREQMLERLDAAVAALSPSDQLLLTLRYQDNRSAGEIASLMSLSTPFHVYRRLNRVHESLRRAVGEPRDREVKTAAQHLIRVPFNIDGRATDPSSPDHDSPFSRIGSSVPGRRPAK